MTLPASALWLAIGQTLSSTASVDNEPPAAAFELERPEIEGFEATIEDQATADTGNGETPASALGSLLDVRIHGFVSQGFILTSANNYLAASKRGSPEFTEAALNFTKSLTDELSTGLQLFARDLGPLGNYSVRFDWFYLDYRWTDWLGFRAGRLKLPFGLYNESSDADSARVPILLPQSIYPTGSRDFLLAQTGAELYGYVELGGVGGVEYRAYGGTIFLEPNVPPTRPFDVSTLETPYLFGGRLLWSAPLEGLRLGGSIQALRLDSDLLFKREIVEPLQASGQLPADFNRIVSLQLPALLWVLSAEYAPAGFLVAAEYSRWNVKLRSTQAVLLPESDTTSERFFVMTTYQVNEWLHPGVYYALQVANVDDREGRAKEQNDFALFVRFDVNPYWLIKLEGHVMRGTVYLSADLNGGTPQAELERDWLLFLAKTTLFF